MIIIRVNLLSGAFLALPSAEADMKSNLQDMCQDLIDLKLISFIEKSSKYLGDVCKTLINADYLAYRNLYNDILASMLAPYNEGSRQFYTGSDSSLRAHSSNTTFLLGFTTGKSAEESFVEIDKVKTDYLNKKKQIVCMGINVLYVKPSNESKHDKIRLEWVANLYNETGDFQRAWIADEVFIECP